MRHTFDEESNAVYIYLTEKPYSFGRRLDDERSIDYSDDGIPTGVELLYVSSGVNVTGLPESDEVAQLLDRIGILSYNFEASANNQVVLKGTSSINVCYAISDPASMQNDEQQCTFVHTFQIPRSTRIPAPEEVTA